MEMLLHCLTMRRICKRRPFWRPLLAKRFLAAHNDIYIVIYPCSSLEKALWAISGAHWSSEVISVYYINRFYISKCYIFWHAKVRSLFDNPPHGKYTTTKLYPLPKTRNAALTLNPLKWKIWWAPNNASRWQMGFNLAFEGLIVMGPTEKIRLFLTWLAFPTVDIRTNFEACLTPHSRYALGFAYT